MLRLLLPILGNKLDPFNVSRIVVSLGLTSLLFNCDLSFLWRFIFLGSLYLRSTSMIIYFALGLQQFLNYIQVQEYEQVRSKHFQSSSRCIYIFIH